MMKNMNIDEVEIIKASTTWRYCSSLCVVLELPGGLYNIFSTAYLYLFSYSGSCKVWTLHIKIYDEMLMLHDII